MNIHDRAPVLGRVVCDRAGRRIGRIVAVDYAATRRCEAWYLVRLGRGGAQFRAVPAAAAHWAAPSRLAAPRVVLDLDRDEVRGSPSLSWPARRAGVRRDVLVAYYHRVLTPDR